LILLIGVGYEANTALHLAEYRLDGAPRRPYRCYVDDRGVRQRCDFIGLDLDDSDFGRLGIALDRQPFVGRGTVGDATARAMPLRPTVDFAVGWMQKHRRQ
jgi:aminoglycoside 3-N-acetyltransferase